MLAGWTLHALPHAKVSEGAGRIPWHKPWISAENGAVSHAQQCKPYSLLNQLLLEQPGEYWSFLDVKQHCFAEYYSTAFHEASHSTGHPHRLARFKDGEAIHFGNAKYAQEELVAELGAAICCQTLGIQTDSSMKRSAAYIGSWLRHLHDDKKLIVYAAGKAEKAAKLIELHPNS